MSLPSSERLPSDINDLPPARQRHIRRQPRSVSLAERQILLDSLIRQTSPTPTFFLRVLLGALALGGAIYLHDLVILIIAIVIFPFQAPLFGLALFPVTLNLKHAVKSLISMLVLMMFVFAAGALAGVFEPINYPDPLSLYRFSSLYWLDLTIIILSVFLSVLALVRQGKNLQGIGVLLSYTLLVPWSVLGFGLSNGNPPLWGGALFVACAHLGLALVVAVLSYLVVGFGPKKALGWLVSIVALTLTLAVISAGVNITGRSSPANSSLAPSPTRVLIATESPSPTREQTATGTHTPTQLQPTGTTTSILSPTTTTTTTTPTPEPAVRWGVVASELGAVIRENPDFDAEIITYANNGDQIQILDDRTTLSGTRWFQVLTQPGETGWLLGSLLQTATPSATITN